MKKKIRREIRQLEGRDAPHDWDWDRLLRIWHREVNRVKKVINKAAKNIFVSDKMRDAYLKHIIEKFQLNEEFEYSGSQEEEEDGIGRSNYVYFSPYLYRR